MAVLAGDVGAIVTIGLFRPAMLRAVADYYWSVKLRPVCECSLQIASPYESSVYGGTQPSPRRGSCW